LGGELGQYLNDEMMPTLENSLSEADWDITPYVNVFNTVPESGFSQFMDYPRYSTGYTALWNTIGMMVETHMLKPYKKRVEGTYIFMEKMIGIAERDSEKIRRLRTEAKFRNLEQDYYPISWEIDSTKSTTFDFKGFEADTIISEVTGFNRLKYDKNRPFIKPVIYQNYFKAIDSVKIPEAYIIRRGWNRVRNLLELNQIDFKTLPKDTILQVQSYKIGTFQTVDAPYEGHYLHSNTQLKMTEETIKFQQGDLFIPTAQNGMRYLVEALEPSATDSFFNWNFFDPILQQKEGFSPYVFEDKALELLEENQVLRDSFRLKKERDSSFAANWYAQLDWLFMQSEYYEKDHMQYPVYRLMK
jgi:hypothetical protein